MSRYTKEPCFGVSVRLLENIFQPFIYAIIMLVCILKDCPSFTDHTQQIDMNEIMNPQRNVKKTEATLISNIYKKINDGP